MGVPSLSPEIPLADLVDRLRRGDAAALSRCLSLVEQGGAHADAIGRLADPATGHAAVVGFSGPPGAGKSTLIDAYIKLLEAGLVKEVRAKAGAPIWRRDDGTGQTYALKLTAAGVKAIAVDETIGPPKERRNGARTIRSSPSIRSPSPFQTQQA